MNPETVIRESDGRERLWAGLLFGGLLIFHAWGASVGWKNLNLPGSEFRETQTAISAYFIQRDHDFSLAYPTPVLGKPWSVPMEFPLYQWTVVRLSDATGMELTTAGRTVSLTCFYLTLPALFLLLGRIGLAWPRRLVALGFVLSCPLYIFYGRSFLIETMALMFAGWFLVGYLKAMEQWRPGWFVFACLVGSAAGLVKVTTFLFVLMPAFGWTTVGLWQRRPGAVGGSWRDMAGTAGRALGTVALPCVAAYWWVRFADATKALNPMADFLRSENMMDFNFGTTETRFAAVIWHRHIAILFREIVGWWTLVGAGLLAILWARRWWGWIVLLVFFFFAVQLVFPVLYAWHEYYYVANAFMLLLAIGLVACGLLESRWPRSVVWGLILALHAGQIQSYLQLKYPIQRVPSNGGSPMTQALRAVTEPDDIIVIAGNDWNSSIPFAAQRRALMIRTGIAHDKAKIASAFARLNGESVGALVLQGKPQDNAELLSRSIRDFGIDPRPVFTFLDSTVYLHRRLRLWAIPQVLTVPDAKYLRLTAESVADQQALLGHEMDLASLPPGYERQFAGMSPRPFKYDMTYGASRMMVEGQDMFFAHPDTRLWFRAAAGPHVITVEVQMLAGTYDESVPVGDQTDGIEVTLSLEGPEHLRRPIFFRWLNPRDQPADRGLQTITQKFEIKTGETVVVEIGSGPEHKAERDWVVLGRVEIK